MQVRYRPPWRSCFPLYSQKFEETPLILRTILHILLILFKKVQVGKDQEKAQSEKRFPLQKPRWEKTKLSFKLVV